MQQGAPETEGDLGRRMTEFIEELQRSICSAVEAEGADAWTVTVEDGRPAVLQDWTVVETLAPEPVAHV